MAHHKPPRSHTNRQKPMLKKYRAAAARGESFNRESVSDDLTTVLSDAWLRYYQPSLTDYFGPRGWLFNEGRDEV